MEISPVTTIFAVINFIILLGIIFVAAFVGYKIIKSSTKKKE